MLLLCHSKIIAHEKRLIPLALGGLAIRTTECLFANSLSSLTYL